MTIEVSEGEWVAEQPTCKLAYEHALAYTEDWLERNYLDAEARAKGVKCAIYDYHDRNAAGLIERPWAGVRVSEVSFHTDSGGASYMQVDQPWGIAFCGEVERCILALVEGWNEAPIDTGASDGYVSFETDEEFSRLATLIEEINALPEVA